MKILCFFFVGQENISNSRGRRAQRAVLVPAKSYSLGPDNAWVKTQEKRLSQTRFMKDTWNVHIQPLQSPKDHQENPQ